MAVTTEWGERWMPGVTFSMPILAVLMMPQRTRPSLLLICLPLINHAD